MSEALETTQGAIEYIEWDSRVPYLITTYEWPTYGPSKILIRARDSVVAWSLGLPHCLHHHLPLRFPVVEEGSEGAVQP